MAQNEMKAKAALPERVRSMEGLGRLVAGNHLLTSDWTRTVSPVPQIALEVRAKRLHSSGCEPTLAPTEFDGSAVCQIFVCSWDVDVCALMRIPK